LKTESASQINPYPGARRQNETEMFSDHDETSPSIAAVWCYIITVPTSDSFISPEPRVAGTTRTTL